MLFFVIINKHNILKALTMESIIALEELIKENEAKVTLQKRQLEQHESGENKLSRMAQASTENTLEIANDLVVKYKKMLEELQTQDAQELAEKERLQFIVERKKYFDAQDSRIKLNKEEENDKKLEAMRIIGELPTDVKFEDNELFEIATKSIELSLPELNELSQILDGIKQEFQTLLKQSEERDLQEIGTIDFLIPVIALHAHVLLSNILENIEDKNNKALDEQKNALKIKEEKQESLVKNLQEQENLKKEDEKNESLNQNILKIKDALQKLEEELIPQVKEETFSGFPKFHDWWIRELWLSHQAYFALFKWKDIVSNLCITTEQKKAWSIIFDRWVFIKKLLNDKGELAFNYNFAFDSLLENHARMLEETESENILSMEKIVKEITKKEDFTITAPFHNTNTPYLKFKKGKVALENKTQV